MSEQEKKSGINEGTKVSVKMSPSSRHKPHRPAEPQEEPGPDLPRRAKAPAVPSDDFKNVVLSGAARDIVSSEKHIVPKKKSSPCKRRGSTPEDVIAMASLTVKKDTCLPQPIPAQIPDHIEKFREEEERESAERADVENKADDDSIAEEIKELRTADAVKEHSEWSDDEEAGGLPRSESRGSRVFRAVRDMFCCGVTHKAPSEEDIPDRTFSAI